jgi:hypothetical protein
MKSIAELLASDAIIATSDCPGCGGSTRDVPDVLYIRHEVYVWVVRCSACRLTKRPAALPVGGEAK